MKPVKNYGTVRCARNNGQVFDLRLKLPWDAAVAKYETLGVIAGYDEEGREAIVNRHDLAFIHLWAVPADVDRSGEIVRIGGAPSGGNDAA